MSPLREVKTPIQRLDQCGDVVSIAQVADIWQFGSIYAVYRAVKAGKFPGAALRHPARWSKADLVRWWNGDVSLPALKKEQDRRLKLVGA